MLRAQQQPRAFLSLFAFLGECQTHNKLDRTMTFG